jgi:hypothetical protein
MKRAYRIVRTRTILTELCVTADSLEELQESLNNGHYDDALDEAESEQWNVVDTNEDITDLTAQRIERAIAMEAMRNKLLNMKDGAILDMVFSNGVVRSTKEVEKVNDNLYLVHSTNNGWSTANLSLAEACDYCCGIKSELNWR